MPVPDIAEDELRGQPGNVRPQSLSTPVDTADTPRASRFSAYLSGLAVRPSPDPVSDFQTSNLGSIQTSPIVAAWSDPQSSGPFSSNTANPEVNSYAYIETLLEALFVLGKLGGALDIITQRVASEIHALVEVTLDEVEERFVLFLRTSH